MSLSKEVLELTSKLVNKHGNWDYEVFEKLEQMGDDILKKIRPQLIECLYRVNFIVDEFAYNLKFTLEKIVKHIGNMAFLRFLNSWGVEDVLDSFYENFLPHYEDGDYENFIIYFREPILEGLKSKDFEFRYITVTFINNILRLINYILVTIEYLPYDENNYVFLKYILELLDWIYDKGAKHYIDNFFSSSCKFSKDELWEMVKNKLK